MKTAPILILVIAAIFGGMIIFVGSDAVNNNNNLEDNNNVSIVDNKQIVSINAKGGYSPKISSAKAGLPTIIRVATKGTFDCSIALRIPALNYRKNLGMTGTTDIEVPPQKPGSTIQGLCGMGMYSFKVVFN